MCSFQYILREQGQIVTCRQYKTTLFLFVKLHLIQIANMSDVENQSTHNSTRPKSWAITTEGVLWGSSLWLSICSNLTLLYGVENALVSKHISCTLCATSLLLTFLLYINHNKNMCFSEKYGQERFSGSFYWGGPTESLTNFHA